MRLLRHNEASVALAFLLMLIAICGTAAAQEFAGREKLRAHSAEFRREVIKVTNGVWVAVGFSDANSALIEGEGGSIVVDTTSSVEDATAVKAEFTQLSTEAKVLYLAEAIDALAADRGSIFVGQAPRPPKPKPTLQ